MFCLHFASIPIYYAFYHLILLLLRIIIITSLLLLFQEENEKVLSKRSPRGRWKTVGSLLVLKRLILKRLTGGLENGVGCEIKTRNTAADNAGVGGRALRRGRPAAGCEAHRRTPGC
jgi:phosphatidylglycerophosphate synthase